MRIIAFILMAMVPIFSFSQNLSIPAEGYKNSIGPAVSTGVSATKNATVWGIEVDYSRVIYKKWIANLSFNYEQENEQLADGNHSYTNSLYPNLAFGYAFTPRIAAGVGVGKTIFDDDNDEGVMNFNSKGGWTVGAVGLYSFHISKRHTIDVSLGVEREFESKDISMSLELGYGYNF